MDYPFLFVGQGFDTSYKCLEGYIWFADAPNKEQQKAIKSLLPHPLQLVRKFSGHVLHYGSDDALEARVKANYGAMYAGMPLTTAWAAADLAWSEGRDDAWQPTHDEWRAFCDDFEKAVNAMAQVVPIVLVLKPGTGEWGRAFGPWHHWSLRNLDAFVAKMATQTEKVTSTERYLAINLLQSLVEGNDDDAAVASASAAKWLQWIDRLIAKPSDINDEFEDFIGSLYAGIHPTERQTLKLSQKLQKIITNTDG